MKPLPLVLFLALGLGSLGAQPVSRSLDTTVTGSWAYADDLGGLGAAPGVSVTLGYALGPSSQLGVTLVRFTPWLAAPQPVYQISYGLEYKHFWSPDWPRLGPWTPWVSYALLLDQSYQQGVDGRGMAHHSRLGLGTDLGVFDRQRLTFEAGWAMSSYAAFGRTKAQNLSSVYAGLGWRFLF